MSAYKFYSAIANDDEIVGSLWWDNEKNHIVVVVSPDDWKDKIVNGEDFEVVFTPEMIEAKDFVERIRIKLSYFGIDVTRNEIWEMLGFIARGNRVEL